MGDVIQLFDIIAPAPPIGPVRFAFLADPEHPFVKPIAFTTLTGLARFITWLREDRPIQLEDLAPTIHMEPEPRPGVSVWTLGYDGDREHYLGWAWLDGAGLRPLQSALDAACPNHRIRLGGR